MTNDEFLLRSQIVTSKMEVQMAKKEQERTTDMIPVVAEGGLRKCIANREFVNCTLLIIVQMMVYYQLIVTRGIANNTGR